MEMNVIAVKEIISLAKAMKHLEVSIFYIVIFHFALFSFPYLS